MRRMAQERSLSPDLSVDGGVNLSNAQALLSAGANVLVAGSAVFDGASRENVRAFLELL